MLTTANVATQVCKLLKRRQDGGTTAGGETASVEGLQEAALARRTGKMKSLLMFPTITGMIV